MIARPSFRGYFIHPLSTLYYYNAPSLATRLTGDYRDRTYIGKCGPALLDTPHNKSRRTYIPCFKIQVSCWLSASYVYSNTITDLDFYRLPIVHNLKCLHIKNIAVLKISICKKHEYVNGNFYSLILSSSVRLTPAVVKITFNSI